MILQNVVIWLIIGLWVAFKRNWYIHYQNDDEMPQIIICGATIVFGPISLVIAIIKEMGFKKWDNGKL